jgi:hypothetical protein
VYATCPTNYTVIGTGFAGVAFPLVYKGSNLGGLSTAAAEVINRGTEAASFSAYALCVPSSLKSWFYQSSRRVEPGGAVGLTKGCPDEWQRVAGHGWWYPLPGERVGPPPPLITASQPAGAPWSSRLYYPESVVPQPTVYFSATVTCVPAGTLQVRDVSATGVSARPLGKTRRHLSCPSGWSIAGGGFRLPSRGTFLTIVTSAPFAKDGGQGWTVGVANTATTPITFDAHAVCIRI